MQKKSTEKPVKKFKKDPIKNREWEKDRRERLNKTFQQLAKLLPNSDDTTLPALSKIEIIQRTINFIGNLRQIIKEFRAGNNETILKNQEELEESLRELILRNRTLIELLKKANITIPSFAPQSCRLFTSMKNGTKNSLTNISDTQIPLQQQSVTTTVAAAATVAVVDVGENNFNELNIKNVGRPPKYSKKISKEMAVKLNEENNEIFNKKIKKSPQKQLNQINENKEQLQKTDESIKLISTQKTEHLSTNNTNNTNMTNNTNNNLASTTIISNILPGITKNTATETTTTTISSTNTTITTTTGVLVPLGNIKLHPQTIIGGHKTNTTAPVIIVKSICNENITNKINERKIQPKIIEKSVKCIAGKMPIPAIKPSRIIFKTKHKRNRKKKLDNSENITKKRKTSNLLETNIVTKKLKTIITTNNVENITTVIPTSSVTKTTSNTATTTGTIITTGATTTITNGTKTCGITVNKEKETNRSEKTIPTQLPLLPPQSPTPQQSAPQTNARHEILINLPEATSTIPHESLSPTAAFLMSFPVVSAAGAVRTDADAVTEDINDSSTCLMQLDDISGTVTTTVAAPADSSQPIESVQKSETSITQLTPSVFTQSPEKQLKPKVTENILLENISSLFTTKDYDRFVEDVTKTEQNLTSSSNGCFSLTTKEDSFDFQLKPIPQLSNNNYQQKIYSSSSKVEESPKKMMPTQMTNTNSTIITDNIFTSPSIMTSSYSGSFDYFNKKQQFGTTSNIDYDSTVIAEPFTFSLTPTTGSYTLTNASCNNDNVGTTANRIAISSSTSSTSDCHLVRPPQLPPPIPQTSCGFYDSLSSIGSSSHHQRRTKPNAAIMYTSALSLSSSSAVCSSSGGVESTTIKPTSIDTTNFVPQTPFTFSLTSSTNTNSIGSKIISTNTTSSSVITTTSPSIFTTITTTTNTTTNTSHHNTYNPFAFDNIPVATYHDNTQFSFCLTSTTTTPTTKTIANHHNNQRQHLVNHPSQQQQQQHQQQHQQQQHQHSKKIKQLNNSSDTQTTTINPFSIDYNLFGETKQKSSVPTIPPVLPPSSSASTVPPPAPVVALPFGICNAATPAPPPPPLVAPPTTLLTSDIESKKLYHKMSAIIGSNNNSNNNNNYYQHNSYITHQNHLINNKLKNNNQQQKPHVNWMTSSTPTAITSSSTMNIIGTAIDDFNPTIPPPIDFTTSTSINNIPSFYPTTKSDIFYAHTGGGVEELPMTFPWSPNKMLDSSSMNATTLPTLHGDLALNTFATKPIGAGSKKEKHKMDCSSNNTLLPPPPARIQRQPLPPLPPPPSISSSNIRSSSEIKSNETFNNNLNSNQQNSHQTNSINNNFFSVSQLVDERKPPPPPHSQSSSQDLNFNPKQMLQSIETKSQKSNLNNRVKQQKDHHYHQHNQHQQQNQSSTTKQRINKTNVSTNVSSSSYIPIHPHQTPTSNIFVDSFTYPNNQNILNSTSTINYQKSTTQSNNYSTEALLSTNQQSTTSQSQRHQQNKKEKYFPIADYYPNHQMDATTTGLFDYCSGALGIGGPDGVSDGSVLVNDYNYFSSSNYLSQNFMDNDYLGASCSSLLPTTSNTSQQQPLYPPLYPPPPPPAVSQSSSTKQLATSSMKVDSNQFLKLPVMPLPPPPPPPPPIPSSIVSSRSSELINSDGNRKTYHKTNFNTPAYNNCGYSSGSTNTASSNYFSFPPPPPPSTLSINDDYHQINHHHHHPHHHPPPPPHHHHHHHQFSLPNYGGVGGGATTTTTTNTGNSVSLPTKNPIPSSSSSSIPNVLYPDQYSTTVHGTSSTTSGGGATSVGISNNGYQPHLLLPTSYHHTENNSIMPSPLISSAAGSNNNNNTNNNNNNNQSGHLVSNFNLSTICPEINDKVVVGGPQNW